MNAEWNNIRPLNVDIKNGFEEHVCQLARAKKINNSRQFIRVATPEGGIESYWQFKDNTEYGWPAKFFTPIGVAQWKQLDESFRTAFDKHPSLVKYYICIPLDREQGYFSD